jgi:hypothetical protein
VFGGLFLAFPAIFPASATLIEQHERRRKQGTGGHGTLRGRRAAALDAAGASIWTPHIRMSGLEADAGSLTVGYAIDRDVGLAGSINARLETLAYVLVWNARTTPYVDQGARVLPN